MHQPVTVIEHIVKEYPSMYKVTIFEKPLIIPRPRPGHKPKRSAADPSEEALIESLRRTRTSIMDYALANEFTHFATFTFNPEKVDRHSFEATSNIMKYWLNRQKKHSPDFAYVIVPELHKNGAIHFHALMKGYMADLTRTNVIQNGHRVYNITGFTSGFTNVKELDDNHAKTAAYITKYLTKENITTFNKRRYWASKNLIKPLKHYDPLDDLGLSHYINPDNLAYQSEEHAVSVYQFTRSPELDIIYNFFRTKPTTPQSESQPVFAPRATQTSLPTIFSQTKPPPYFA